MTETFFKRMAYLLMIGWGMLLYVYTLPFPFEFDDFPYLVDNPLVKDIRNFAYWSDFSSFATLSQRLGLDPDLSTNFILRPIAYFTFYLNVALAGLKPMGFRAVNIGLHCANAVLLFQILWNLLRSSRKHSSLSLFSAGFIALSSALLFLSHPLQTESVTYIVQRFTSLGAFFYLVTVWTYFLSYSFKGRKHISLLRGCSVATLILGMLSKEFVFTAPFMLVIIDCLIMGTSLKQACKSAAPHFLCLPIIPVFILMTAAAQHGGQLSFSGALNVANSIDAAQEPYYYALTQLRVILSYLGLILIPYGLNLDRDYPLSRSLLEGQVLLSIVLIVAINTGSWLWFRKRQEDLRRSLLFCSVLWYFITLAPDSSVVPLPDLMADHRSYLPSIGALTALACCVDALRAKMIRARIPNYFVTSGMALWVLVLSVTTCMRNRVWRTEVSLWHDTATKSPNKFRPWSNLGVAYFEHNKPQDAIACMLKALRLEPRFINGYINLSIARNALGQYQQAIDTSELGLHYAPRNATLRYNMGLAYYQLGQTNESIQCLTLATNLCGTDPRFHTALGIINTQLHQYDDALKSYRLAASLRPHDQKLRQTILQIEALAR